MSGIPYTDRNDQGHETMLPIPALPWKSMKANGGVFPPAAVVAAETSIRRAHVSWYGRDGSWLRQNHVVTRCPQHLTLTFGAANAQFALPTTTVGSWAPVAWAWASSIQV